MHEPKVSTPKNYKIIKNYFKKSKKKKIVKTLKGTDSKHE